MKTAEYLDAIKARHNLPSDYAAAKLIGVTRSAVSRYRHGADSFADPVALRVAELLDLDPASVLIDCQMERAPDPATRAAWGALLARIGTHAAPLVVLLLLVTACDKFALDGSIYSLSILPVTVFRTKELCGYAPLGTPHDVPTHPTAQSKPGVFNPRPHRQKPTIVGPGAPLVGPEAPPITGKRIARKCQHPCVA